MSMPMLVTLTICRVKIVLTLITKKLLVWSLAYKTTLVKQYFMDSEPKAEVINFKIDQLAAIWTSKFKWAWRAQFLSHTLQIFEINLSFDVFKMILQYLINISFSFWNLKKWKRVISPSLETSMNYPFVLIYSLKSLSCGFW